MTDKSSKTSSHLKLTNQFLKGSGAFWFVAAALGQALFFYFIVKFYYTSTLSGNFEWWDRKNIITGFVKNDTIGNYNFALHVLIAAIITLCGILQLIPYVRKNFRKLHRISGRIFIISSIITVSYTHLDVYKRQGMNQLACSDLASQHVNGARHRQPH